MGHGSLADEGIGQRTRVVAHDTKVSLARRTSGLRELLPKKPLDVATLELGHVQLARRPAEKRGVDAGTNAVGSTPHLVLRTTEHFLRPTESKR